VPHVEREPHAQRAAPAVGPALPRRERGQPEPLRGAVHDPAQHGRHVRQAGQGAGNAQGGALPQAGKHVDLGEVRLSRCVQAEVDPGHVPDPQDLDHGPGEPQHLLARVGREIRGHLDPHTAGRGALALVVTELRALVNAGSRLQQPAGPGGRFFQEGHGDDPARQELLHEHPGRIPGQQGPDAVLELPVAPHHRIARDPPGASLVVGLHGQRVGEPPGTDAIGRFQDEPAGHRHPVRGHQHPGEMLVRGHAADAGVRAREGDPQPVEHGRVEGPPAPLRGVEHQVRVQGLQARRHPGHRTGDLDAIHGVASPAQRPADGVHGLGPVELGLFLAVVHLQVVGECNVHRLSPRCGRTRKERAARGGGATAIPGARVRACALTRPSGPGNTPPGAAAGAVPRGFRGEAPSAAPPPDTPPRGRGTGRSCPRSSRGRRPGRPTR